MAAVTDYKAAENLPKVLLKMLNTLTENGVKTWHIYPDKVGIYVRIRFRHCKQESLCSVAVNTVMLAG